MCLKLFILNLIKAAYNSRRFKSFILVSDAMFYTGKKFLTLLNVIHVRMISYSFYRNWSPCFFHLRNYEMMKKLKIQELLMLSEKLNSMRLARQLKMTMVHYHYIRRYSTTHDYCSLVGFLLRKTLATDLQILCQKQLRYLQFGDKCDIKCPIRIHRIYKNSNNIRIYKFCTKRPYNFQ